MTVMALSERDLDLPTGRPLTVDDLARTPDDGRKYELDDGSLDVTSAPVALHTRAEGRLVTHLSVTAPDEVYEVHASPGVTLNDAKTSHRLPDIAVLRTVEFEMPHQTRPPVLVVEVLSPESVFRDTQRKKREYAAFGVESYWIVNPSLENPGILAFRLRDGEYREIAQVYGADVFAADSPFPIRIVLEWLVADGPWKAHVAGPSEGSEGPEAPER